MLNLKLNKTVLFVVLATASAQAQTPERITAIHFNKGKVERIYMAPGLATAVTFPCDLDEATVGREEDLKAKVSPTTKKHLTLFLASSASMPTNLIVRCGDKQELYVFDVIPSRTNHQDVLRITGTYGGAVRRDDNNLELIDSDRSSVKKQEQKKSNQRIDPSTLVMIESSTSYKPRVKGPQIIEREKPQEVSDKTEQSDLKSLENRRSTAIIVEKPQLIEEQVRETEKEDFKRSLTGTDQIQPGGGK